MNCLICVCSRPALSWKSRRGCGSCASTSRASRPEFLNCAERPPEFYMSETNLHRGHRKERVGEVISDKMDKTIVVRVERRFRHPQFKKVVTAYSKFYAHDEKNEAKVGDRVRIQETRPLSRSKSWRLIEIVERTREVAKVA